MNDWMSSMQGWGQNQHLVPDCFRIGLCERFSFLLLTAESV